jgi:hypothetical protein
MGPALNLKFLATSAVTWLVYVIISATHKQTIRYYFCAAEIKCRQPPRNCTESTGVAKYSPQITNIECLMKAY